MTFDHESLAVFADMLRTFERGFDHLPDAPASPEASAGAFRDVLLETAERLRDNLPYHHPLYIGQMLKPPCSVARLAYALAMFLNPNNHALEGGRATSIMEREAVAGLARMFGWEEHLGHLCGGGTIANFEALWIGRELQPGRAVAASTQAHYTHERLSAVLGVPFQAVPADERGRMSVSALERALETGNVGTVVVTLGTTAEGTIDPLPAVLELRQSYDFRVHVDAAYGGYYVLARGLGREARAAFDRASEADSIVIDPHKHGLQPYGCGCVLFRDPGVARFYGHESPYTYFASAERHLGEISLECSRAGASAAALWATMRALPLEPGGTFARGLEACRDAARALYQALLADDRFAPLGPPELDIVVWAVRAETASAASRRARAVFEAAARNDLHLALAAFPRAMFEHATPVARWDQDDILCLRACAMKPEHREWMPEIIKRLRMAVGAAF